MKKINKYRGILVSTACSHGTLHFAWLDCHSTILGRSTCWQTPSPRGPKSEISTGRCANQPSRCAPRGIRRIGFSPLGARHNDLDGLIPSQVRIGKFSGGTRISMLLRVSA